MSFKCVAGSCTQLGFLVALAAGVAGCRPDTTLQGLESPTPGPRKVQLEISYALAGVDTEIEIIEVAVGQAKGRVQVRSGDVNRQEIERAYRCTARETLDRGFAEWICLADLGGREPNWAALLEELDAAGIMSPPRELPPAFGCLDGAPWALRVYNGASPTPAVEEKQICPVTTPARQFFQAEIERIIDLIVSTVVERASGA